MVNLRVKHHLWIKFQGLRDNLREMRNHGFQPKFWVFLQVFPETNSFFGGSFSVQIQWVIWIWTRIILTTVHLTCHHLRWCGQWGRYWLWFPQSKLNRVASSKLSLAKASLSTTWPAIGNSHRNFQWCFSPLTRHRCAARGEWTIKEQANSIVDGRWKVTHKIELMWSISRAAPDW